MRIMLALGWYFPDSLGGTEVYVRSLAQLLVAHGHDVRVVAPRAGAPDGEEYELDGVRVFRYPVPLDPSRAEVQGDVVTRGASILHDFVAAWRPDVFHAHSLVTGLGLFELWAARNVGAHVVYTNHLPSMGFICARGTLLRDGVTACDGIQDEARCGACLLQQRDVPASAARGIAALPASLARTLSWIPGPAGTALGIRELVRKAARKQQELVALAARLVVLNEWAARIFIANGAPAHQVAINRLGVSHPGLTRTAETGRNPTRAPIDVGYVGRLHEVKGLHVLAEAMRRIPGDVPLRVHVAGPADDAHADSVKRAFADATASDTRVTIGGPIAPADIAAHLRTLDLLCCPSLWFENGPTIALEAMAVGTPVLGTRLGAFVEIVKDGVNGRLVEPGDAAGLAGALIEIARNPAGTIDRWRAALEPPRTMQQIAADYLTLYEGLSRRPAAVQ